MESIDDPNMRLDASGKAFAYVSNRQIRSATVVGYEKWRIAKSGAQWKFSREPLGTFDDAANPGFALKRAYNSLPVVALN